MIGFDVIHVMQVHLAFMLQRKYQEDHSVTAVIVLYVPVLLHVATEFYNQLIKFVLARLYI